jgi:hypothetical protein
LLVLIFFAANDHFLHVLFWMTLQF